MASLSPDVVRRLLSKYKFMVDQDTNIDDLTCTICKNLMIDAYQSSCGCHYCYECLKLYVSTGDKFCIGNKEECKDEPLVLDGNIFKSAMLNKRIRRLTVICPNESCAYRAKLPRMEDHLRMCDKQSLECPYASLGCDNERGSRSSIETHIHTQALPHTQLLMEWIGNLRNEVNVLKDAFATNKSEMESVMEEQRREIAVMREEARTKEIKMNELLNQMTLMKKEIEIMKGESKGFNETNESSDRGSSKCHRDPEEKLMVTSTKDDRAHEVTLTKINQLEAIVKKLNIGTNKMVAIGVTVVTINKFQARKSSRDYIHSPFFYSNANGYKLQLLIYPGGNLEGRGSHLSVYIYICQGEYDDILSWPCRLSFNISLINQYYGETHQSLTYGYETASDNLKYTYYKPTDGDNVGNGCSLFISHADLQSVNGLIVNDSVLIKCTVNLYPSSSGDTHPRAHCQANH